MKSIDITSKLLSYKAKTISIEDLASILHVNVHDTENLHKVVSALIDDGLISAIQSSDTNGNRQYPLHKKYRILVKRVVDDESIVKMKRLNPKLLKNGFLSAHPDYYQEHSRIIDAVSRFFFSNEDEEYISRKERSFEIFGWEKELDQADTKTLLNKLGISAIDLMFYDTPEYCFHDYIPVRKDKMTLLICENKDIWFNIRRLMFEDGTLDILGTKIDGVVYGNGNKVSQKQGALVEYIHFMGDPTVKFLYWGDIDRAGFDIFKRTKEVNSSLDISLFVSGYQKMIELSDGMKMEASPSSKLEETDFSDLFDCFTERSRDFLLDVLRKNLLIPQEIISYKVLKQR